jgi:spore coat protein CotH
LQPKCPSISTLDRYITFYAVEAATSNYDGFSFNTNNAYLYTHPKDGAG